MARRREIPIDKVWTLLGGEGEPDPNFSALWDSVVEIVRSKDGPLPEILDKCYDSLQCASTNLAVSPETLAAGLESLAQIQLTPPSQLQESKGDEAFVGGEYAGRLVLELLQNAHDALAWRHGSQQVIGRFGIGMKGLAGVVRSFTMSSGPWQLRYGAEELSELAGRELSLFRYPLPMSRPRIDRLDDLNGVDVSFEILEREDGIEELVLRHRGLPFDAADVFSMQMRHRSDKRRERAACDDCPVTEFRFVLGQEESTIRRIREQLGMLGPEDLLFLPHVNTLEIIDGGERRVVETALRREWLHEGTRFSIVEGPGVGVWVKAEDSAGRSVALPVENRRDEQELYSWFRITLVRVPLPLMFHLPDLKLGRTREHLDDSGDAARDNGRELLAACRLATLMLIALADRLGEELESQEREWLETAIVDMPGPLFPSNTILTVPEEEEVGGIVKSEDAGTEFARWLAYTLGEEDLPSIACWDGGAVRLEPPSSVLDIRNDFVEEGLELFGSPLPVGSRFPTVEAAERLASKVKRDYSSIPIAEFLGLKKPDSGEIERAYRALFGECSEERGSLLLVRAPMHDAAARVGLWLERIDEALLVDVFPVPVEGTTSNTTNLLVRMPNAGEDTEIREAYGDLGWASLIASSYGERLAEVKSELNRRGVVQANPADVLRRLYEGSFSCEQAKAIVRLAWHCFSSMRPQLPEEDYPLLFAARHLHRMFLNFKHTLLSPGSPSAWPAWMSSIHLSGIPLPAKSGELRRACELTSSDQMEPSLVVDRVRIAEWIGDDEAEQLLDACNVWKGSPLMALIRRPFERGDHHFEKNFKNWLGSIGPRSFWRRQSFYAVDGDDWNYQARCDINRMHRMPLAWWSRGKKGQPHTIHKEWYRHAGHDEEDKIAWIVDVPHECRDTEGNVRDVFAQEYATLLCDQELTGWTFFIDDRPEREGLQLVNYRATQLGDLSSPLRVRISQTPFLQSAPGLPAKKVRPIEAIQWDGARLLDSPVQILPVVVSRDASDALSLDGLLVVDRLRSSPQGQSLDPRWLLGTIFRLSTHADINEDTVAVNERLIGALAHAAGAESPKGIPGPKDGESWKNYFDRWEFNRPRRLVEDWMADAVECGFLESRLISGWPSDKTEGLLGELPLLVRDDQGYRFCKLRDAWKGLSVIFSHTADEQTTSALRQHFSLARLPSELRACHLLQIPWYVPQRKLVRFTRPRSESPAQTLLQPLVERLREPIVHFIASNSTPKIDVETLKARWIEGRMEIQEFEPDEVSVQLAGFEKGLAIAVSLHATSFLPVRNAGRGGRDTQPALAVNSHGCRSAQVTQPPGLWVVVQPSPIAGGHALRLPWPLDGLGARQRP